MALGANTVWEVRATGASANGGGFNVGNANFAGDLTATAGTGSSPVVSSASYTFAAGDVGSLLFVKSGTNWAPGWYAIASVSGGAATLTASVGSVSLYGGATLLNASAGCASTASPTGGTWSIDYSQQASAGFAFTDMVIDGTTNTKFTSSAHPIGKNMVGNLIKIASGTGFTVQTVEVVSVSGTTGTADKSLGTLSSTGGTGSLGGAKLLISDPIGVMVRSNKVFVQAGAGYTITASITLSTAGGTPSQAAPPNRMIGYSSYRGDGGQAAITLSTNSGITALNMTTVGWIVEGFAINCAGLSNSNGLGVNSNGGATIIRNCKISNATSSGISISQNTSTFGCLVVGNEVTGGAVANGAIIGSGVGAFNLIRDNWVHDNTGPGIIGSSSDLVIEGNLVTNNSGASSDGIRPSGGVCAVRGNTVYNSGRHGIFNNTTAVCQDIRGNLLSSNGGYGIVGASAAGYPSDVSMDGNTYYNNTSGTRSNMDDAGSTNAVNGVASYVNQYDVILTADPFMAASSNDFRLNTTAGGGAACRGHGLPTAWPGNSLTTSKPDMGASQHADPTGAVFNPIGCAFIQGVSSGP